MNVSVEVSYYPLHSEYIPPIKDFIGRINNYPEIKTKTNGMSTQVFGEYFKVMQILTNEIHKSFELPHSVFIMKVINADLNVYDGGDR